MVGNINVVHCVDWLKGTARNDTSQFGEDGLIEAVLARIGVEHRWCFEVGAGDGVEFSNVHRLISDGWNAVLIEADDAKMDALTRFASDSVHVVHQKIGLNSLDRILLRCGAPVDLDLGVIDIDGQDFWAWTGLQIYRPRVMLVEVQPSEGAIPAIGGEGQAGRLWVKMLGETKGYISVAGTHCNELFCRADVLV